MKKTIYNTENISPSCSYCIFGRLSPDRENVLCVKKGIVPKDYFCRKYKYDVIKRVPRRAANLQKFDQKDFDL